MSSIGSHLLAGLAGFAGAPVVAATEGDDPGEGGRQADTAGARMGWLPGARRGVKMHLRRVSTSLNSFYFEGSVGSVTHTEPRWMGAKSNIVNVNVWGNSGAVRSKSRSTQSSTSILPSSSLKIFESHFQLYHQSILSGKDQNPCRGAFCISAV